MSQPCERLAVKRFLHVVSSLFSAVLWSFFVVSHSSTNLCYLIKSVDIIWKKVHNLSSGGLSHRLTAETKSLMREILLVWWVWPEEFKAYFLIRKICWIFADLSVYHVTHGHSYLHACSLDVVEVEMLEDSQSKGGEGHRSGITIHHAKTSLVVRVIILKVQDYFPQKKWLDDFNGLLYGKYSDKKYTLDDKICQKCQIHPLLMLDMGRTALNLFQAITRKSCG